VRVLTHQDDLSGVVVQTLGAPDEEAAEGEDGWSHEQRGGEREQCDQSLHESLDVGTRMGTVYTFDTAADQSFPGLHVPGSESIYD
jgi:hypothetical protein